MPPGLPPSLSSRLGGYGRPESIIDNLVTRISHSDHIVTRRAIGGPHVWGSWARRHVVGQRVGIRSALQTLSPPHILGEDATNEARCCDGRRLIDAGQNPTRRVHAVRECAEYWCRAVERAAKHVSWSVMSGWHPRSHKPYEPLTHQGVINVPRTSSHSVSCVDRGMQWKGTRKER